MIDAANLLQVSCITWLVATSGYPYRLARYCTDVTLMYLRLAMSKRRRVVRRQVSLVLNKGLLRRLI
jgi:hypothetical protein